MAVIISRISIFVVSEDRKNLRDSLTIELIFNGCGFFSLWRVKLRICVTKLVARWQASSTFANLSTPSNQELNSLVKKDGPKKGIHSSKGYGINKILGDLDKSGDLSAYEAKRQAAIEKNMSEGSTKKGYKH